MSQVVGLPNNSYKPITNTAWARARLYKLQKWCTRLTAASDKGYQLLGHYRWFSPGTPASSTTKTGRHHIVEILQKVALNTINQIKSIRYAFAKKEHAVSIYFDLEKTYDTTWKYDILKEMFYMGLKGKLPNVISNFLSGRKFNVRVKSIYSDIQEQEMKVPIGKVTLRYIAQC